VAAAGAVTIAAERLDPLARRHVPGWTRPNYHGRPVSLIGGAAVSLGALAGATVAGAPSRRAALLAIAGAAVAGGYDDLVAPRTESSADKGLRGHLAAVRAGRLSGGLVKVAVIGTAATVAASALPARPVRPTRRRVALRAAVIAGSANLANLLDLRPGRAGKVVAAASLPLLYGPVGATAATALGATLAELPGDLAERTMLGDAGANVLGGLLGVRLAAGSDRTAAAALTVITALTLASERWSFSGVIDAHPLLRAADRFGRRP
jgi:UDP-N-acetylmuramyl pentapeptide phosphotransferase/UDP-N-acetylglucosamine-1-phosphate transferase